MMRLTAHPSCRGSSLRALQLLISMTHGVLCFVKNSLSAKTQHRACASVSRSFPSTRLDQSWYQTALYNIICFTDTSDPSWVRSVRKAYDVLQPKTLRHLYLVPKCSSPVPNCLKTLRHRYRNVSASCQWLTTSRQSVAQYTIICSRLDPHCSLCYAMCDRRTDGHHM